jgi:GrpB-like predicted nucleotidyltransferase (UPF0157 family)
VGSEVRIGAYDPSWAEDAAALSDRLLRVLGPAAVRVDHIGSTSVPGLAAKDVVDLQVTVADDAGLDSASGLLEGDGWRPPPGLWWDHVPAGVVERDDRDWTKRFFREPDGERRVNLHVRVDGRPNQRYALLFRDYVRAHDATAMAYATLKRDLASLIPDDSERYADVKDAACDLIYLAAEEWATTTGWTPGAPTAPSP